MSPPSFIKSIFCRAIYFNILNYKFNFKSHLSTFPLWIILWCHIQFPFKKTNVQEGTENAFPAANKKVS